MNVPVRLTHRQLQDLYTHEIARHHNFYNWQEMVKSFVEHGFKMELYEVYDDWYDTYYSKLGQVLK